MEIFSKGVGMVAWLRHILMMEPKSKVIARKKNSRDTTASKKISFTSFMDMMAQSLKFKKMVKL